MNNANVWLYACGEFIDKLTIFTKACTMCLKELKNEGCKDLKKDIMAICLIGELRFICKSMVEI